VILLRLRVDGGSFQGWREIGVPRDGLTISLSSFVIELEILASNHVPITIHTVVDRGILKNSMTSGAVVP
jgi:hypothetical protein